MLIFKIPMIIPCVGDNYEDDDEEDALSLNIDVRVWGSNEWVRIQCVPYSRQ